MADFLTKIIKGLDDPIVTKKKPQVTTTIDKEPTPVSKPTTTSKGGLGSTLVIGTHGSSIVSTHAEAYDKFKSDLATEEAEKFRVMVDTYTKTMGDTLTVHTEFLADADMTDVERINFLAKLAVENISATEASYKYNVADTWDTMLSDEITDRRDFDWLQGGRGAWFKENEPYMDAHFKTWWRETDTDELPSNREDAQVVATRYADELHRAIRAWSVGKNDTLFGVSMGEEGDMTALSMMRGFVADFVTSFASPQDLALAVATGGYYKWGKGAKRWSDFMERTEDMNKFNRNMTRYMTYTFLGGATALTYEETRQALKGIDLDNEESMVILGGILGFTSRGIQDVFGAAKDFFLSLTKKEQIEVLQDSVEVVKEVENLEVKEVGAQDSPQQTKPEAISKKEEDGDPTVADLEQEIIDDHFEFSAPTLSQKKVESKVSSYVTSTSNPSPLLRAYNSGIQTVYNILSKLKASPNTLFDADGNVVVQLGPTADSIYRKEYMGSHNILVSKLRNLTNKYIADLDISKTANIITLGKKKRSAERDFTLALDTALKQQTALHRKKRTSVDLLQELLAAQKERLKNAEAGDDARELFRAKTVVAKFEKNLQELESEVVETLSSGNPHIDEAVREIQEQYKFYNTKTYELAKRDMLKKHDEDLTAVADRDGDIDTLMDKQDAELLAQAAYYKDRSLGYSPRYWSQEALASDPKAVEKLEKSLKNSPYAKSLEKYDPQDYKLFLEEIPAIAKNMVNKIKNKETDNELRDLGGSRISGSGDKASGKSEIGRRIDVDELEVQDLVQSDWTTVMQAYSYDMGHKLSFREAFDVKDYKEFEAIYLGEKGTLTTILDNSSLSKDAKRRLIADVKVSVEEALGTRGLIKNYNGLQSGKNVLVSTANASMGWGFGFTTLAEAGPIVTRYGRDLIPQLVPGIKQVVADYKAKGFTEGTMDEIRGFGIGSGIQNSRVSSMLEDGTFYAFNQKATIAKRWTEGARKVANAGYHLGGFHSLTSLFKYASAGAFQAKVWRVGNQILDGKPLSKAQERYFARMGMDNETLIRIARMPLKDSNGNQNYNMSGWDDDLQELTWDSMNRATNESVLDPSGYDMPSITSGGDNMAAVSGIFMQWKRFPLAAYNAYVKNGVSDGDARIAASGLASVGVLGSFLYMGEEIEIAKGTLAESDRRYPDTDRGMTQLMIDSIVKSPATSLAPEVISKAAAATGNPNPASGYKQALWDTFRPPAFTLIGKGVDIVVDAWYEERVEGLIRLLKYAPPAKHPFIEQSVEKLIETVDR